ncbi:patatin-like phospholipase family protein [Naumannella sp. ID2617S]|nr:patatin-like phospholipase family protein [Naumannella sp. ID2617S]
MTETGSGQVPPSQADLVMEGGGVRGVAFGGVLEVLTEHGYRFERIAGTSSGALTAALVAALQLAGESAAAVREIAATLDLRRFRDSGAVGRAMGPLHSVADVFSLAFEGGLYEGDYLVDWLSGVLSDLGVATFGDLRRVDPGSALPPEQEYALVVVASDLSRRRMTLFPWDCAGYGLDPDELSVAHAVRASAAIPFFFEPARFRTPRGIVSLVDGGILSNYPITIFDQPVRSQARWPTIGVRLSAREGVRAVEPVNNALEIGMALVDTMMNGIDARHIDDPDTITRTIFVDSGDVRSTDFSLSRDAQEDLARRGRAAAVKWLGGQGQLLA